MKAEQFYGDLLGLTPEWEVTSVDTNLADMEVHIHVQYTKRKAKCPETGQQCSIYDHRSDRAWRHLNTMQFKTYIHCRVPRVKNQEGKVVTIEVPWADKTERFTYLFEGIVIQTLEATKNQTATAKLVDTSFDVVNRIMHRSVKRGLQRRHIRDDLSQIAIDEKSFKRGHQYVTIVFDSEASAVLDLARGRTQKDTEYLLESTFNQSQLEKMEVVSMDMWKAYINAVSRKMPQAKIAHDKFHLVKYLTDMIDKVRRKEVKEQELLRKSRWTLLKNYQNHTEKQRLQWEAILNTNLETAKAWRVRETFKDIYDTALNGTAKLWSMLLKWINMSGKIQNPIIQKVVTTFYDHLPGILNAIKTKATNAIAEKLNGKIQELKSVGKGYRRYENFRSAILFFNGKLDLYPQQIQ